MKSKLLGAALLTIAGFAIADLTREAATTLTTFLASNAAPDPVVDEPVAAPPSKIGIHRASLETPSAN